MYYTIYKTTNIITKQEYIGQHITKNLNDSYIGSGTRLWHSIRKYGKENFKKELLFVYDNFEDMNAKEIELVNEDWLSNMMSLNVVLGGIGFQSKDTLVVFDILLNKFVRIHKNNFDRSIHKTLNKDKILVKFIEDSNDEDWFFISTYEYNLNKNLYKTPSTGKVSVFDNTDNKTKSITLSERYDNPDRYTCVFGGIVAKVDGVNTYVSKEEFLSKGLSANTKGLVTVIELSTGISKDISKQEYKDNKHLYKTHSTGKTNATHKITGKKIRIDTSEMSLYEDEYFFSTAGQVTVFSIKDNCYLNVSKKEYSTNKKLYRAWTSGLVVAYEINSKNTKYSLIPKEKYDNSIHKLPKDVYLEFFVNDVYVGMYFGNKTGLIEFLDTEFKIKVSKDFKIKNVSDVVLLSDNNVKYTIKEIDWRVKYGLKK